MKRPSGVTDARLSINISQCIAFRGEAQREWLGQTEQLLYQVKKKKDFLTCYIKNHPGLLSGDRYRLWEEGTRLPRSPSMAISGMGILFPSEPGKVPLPMTLEMCLKTGHGPVWAWTRGLLSGMYKPSGQLTLIWSPCWVLFCGSITLLDNKQLVLIHINCRFWKWWQVHR